MRKTGLQLTFMVEKIFHDFAALVGQNTRSDLGSRVKDRRG